MDILPTFEEKTRTLCDKPWNKSLLNLFCMEPVEQRTILILCLFATSNYVFQTFRSVIQLKLELQFSRPQNNYSHQWRGKKQNTNRMTLWEVLEHAYLSRLVRRFETIRKIGIKTSRHNCAHQNYRWQKEISIEILVKGTCCII